MKRLFRPMLGLFASLILVLTGVAHAGVVDSATLMRMEQRVEMAQEIQETLAQETFSRQLLAMGVDPAQVQARIAQLTDEELNLLHARLNELPAGGNDLLVALGIVLVVLIVLEALNITNIITVR